MIISVELDYLISKKSLQVEVCVPGTNIILDLSQPTKKIDMIFSLPLQPQQIDMTFSCSNIDIVHHPVTISNIVLDNFYSFSNIVYKGQPQFDQQFLALASEKNIYLDHNITDSNRLDFTGTLVYQFMWPFYKNLFT